MQALQRTVDSPQKKVVMAGLVAVMAYGLKMANVKAPTEVKNMKNEKGKVKRDFFLISFRAKEKATSIDFSGSA